MAANRWLALWVGLFLSAAISAQNADRVTQNLTWPRVEGAQSYELRVWDENGLVLQRILEEPHLELQLKPGTYRYQIRVYNVLDQVEVESPLRSFVVLRAEVPQPQGFSPSQLEWGTQVKKFTLKGAALVDGARIELVRRDALSGGVPSSAQAVVISRTDGEWTVEFPGFEFVPGVYDLVVQNPGGLKRTLAGALQVAREGTYNLHLSVGYLPGLPVFDSWFLEVWNRGWVPGWGARFEVVLLPGSHDLWGLAGTANTWTHLGGWSEASLTSRYLSSGIEGVYSHLLSQEFRVGARLGGGVTTSWHSFEYRGNPGVSWVSLDPYTRLEVNASYWFTRAFYLEAGTALDMGFNYGFVAGMLRPSLMGGWAF